MASSQHSAALLIPLDADPASEKGDEVWVRLEKLGKKLAEGWQNEKSAAEILLEMRR
jgi:hypothetical protein